MRESLFSIMVVKSQTNHPQPSSRDRNDNSWHGYNLCDYQEHFVTHSLDDIPGISTPTAHVLRVIGWEGTSMYQSVLSMPQRIFRVTEPY